MQNQPPASISGIHSAFNPSIQAHIQQAYQLGQMNGYLQGYQVGFMHGEASAARSYFPVSLPQVSQQPHTSYNIQPAASSSTQQLVPQPPQGVAVAGTSGVQSGYSRREDRQYQCNTCQYLTKHKHAIETHVHRHTGKKPFKCQHCDYKSGYPSNLSRHIKNKHTPQPAAPKHDQPPAKKTKPE